MKCPAIACLWPGSPPSHRITAVAVLHRRHELFSGGYDGAIVRWSISGRNVRPLALLCGHAAEIRGLAACLPDSFELDSSNPMSFSSSRSALFSACADGVLCIWTDGSFRCRRRRKLPPWAGIPSHLVLLSSSPSHVCVACSSGESSKSSVLIVDSRTLNVVQTVFHGNLGAGVVKSMAIVPLEEEIEKGKKAVFLVDGSGKAQLLALSKESSHDGEVSSSMNRGSSSDSPASVRQESLSSDVVQAAAVARDGKLVAVIFESRCEFRSVLNGMVVGEISLLGASLCDGNSSTLTGGTFLYADASFGISKTHFSEEASTMSFALWNCNGVFVLYNISNLDTSINSELICRIPPPLRNGEGSLFHFCQLNDSLVRLESMSFSLGHLLVWRPSITICSITEFELMQNDNCSLSVLLGEGAFSGFQAFQQTKNMDENAKDGLRINERFISSSLVLSEDFYVPYAVVYGFYNGEIEVARLLNLSPCTNSIEANLQQSFNLRTTASFFSGHTSAVICLAAHHMAASLGNLRVHRILVSGSIDSTIRIWDLDSGSPLSVMHHHIAPVKQIILPPARTDRPWKDCFLSVGEDGCVALVSFETLRVERMFPGHPSYPSMVVWDIRRGYLACLCRSISTSDSVSMLIIWDVKTGARERIIRGSASHSMMDHFCKDINVNYINGSLLGGTTSASALLLPIIEDSTQSLATRTDAGTGAISTAKITDSYNYLTNSSKGKLPFMDTDHDSTSNAYSLAWKTNSQYAQIKKYPVTCSCLFPGIANLQFNLSSLVSVQYAQNNDKQADSQNFPRENMGKPLPHESSNDSSDSHGIQNSHMKEPLEGYLLRFSLCFLHLWDIDQELDKLLKEEMDVCKPKGFEIAAGIVGDRGSMTMMFPGLFATLELWKSSSEFCAMRSLMIVSLAQRMIGLYHSTTTASSALAAFYTRNFAEEVPDVKPPLLQLLVSFWQDPSEHVRMAARSLFHCAAPRAIPLPLYCHKTMQPGDLPSPMRAKGCALSESDQTPGNGYSSSENFLQEPRKSDFDIVSWLDSYEIHEWVSCIGGTSQDAMSSHIIVAAALVVWYPSKVKDNLAKLVADRLVKLVMAMNDQFSSTAAELLSEGMESIWKSCLGPEIPRLVGDIFFQIECISGTPASSAKHNASVAANIQEALVGILLPSLAMADIIGFLNVIEDQIWSTSSDSPVHLASLKTLIRVVRASPKSLALYLDKVVNYVLQTMDPGNLVMRKACRNNSLLALKDIARVFPMVALNESLTRLAVGDAIGDLRSVSICVYDVESVTKLKILDASGPLGLPSLLEGRSSIRIATAISALSFSPDGEGLVAFSENGLMIRWWSLGTAWWEKLSRNLVPIQCAKLIFVPPWEGFSPNSSRSSIMENIVGNDRWNDTEEKPRESDEADRIKLLLHNLDLSYRLQWVGGRNVLLTRHGQQLGAFPL